MYISIIVALALLTMIPTSVFAGGPRLDYPYPGTDEEADCWVDGYDAGFAGKYDKDRAKECLEDGGDSYNESWDGACRDGGYTENECADFINNPVDLGDHEQLKEENTQACWNDGYEDGKADRPFNKDRSSACSEYGSQYRSAYQSGCQLDSTEESCELLIEREETYCPDNPDSTSCVEFLHNATNKRPALTGTCAGMGDHRPNIICPQESDPERYCLNTDDPVFCKTIGDLCDADGFVRPEYPYCTK